MDLNMGFYPATWFLTDSYFQQSTNFKISLSSVKTRGFYTRLCAEWLKIPFYWRLSLEKVDKYLMF